MKRKHHDLECWQTAMSLAKAVYALTASFPAHEVYGLTSQIRRSAVSVPSNIAEGSARLSEREFLHFLGIARGSLSELETQLLLARDIGYWKDESFSIEMIDRLFGLLGGLINHLRMRVET